MTIIITDTTVTVISTAPLRCDVNLVFIITTFHSFGFPTLCVMIKIKILIIFYSTIWQAEYSAHQTL